MRRLRKSTPACARKWTTPPRPARPRPIRRSISSRPTSMPMAAGHGETDMPELSYRDAVIRGIAQEMSRDPDVVFLGEDVAKAGGVFKATVGLYEQFGPLRVRDTPISEQAILGAAMGAAMTGLKPIAEIMFSDFFAVCFDYIANEFPKSRYMT